MLCRRPVDTPKQSGEFFFFIYSFFLVSAFILNTNNKKQIEHGGCTKYSEHITTYVQQWKKKIILIISYVL